jgi:lipopolysaccharide export system protein LptA
VWSPKRVLLLVAGFSLFFITYLVYARFLGGIDGLAPLPQAYWPGVRDPEVQPLPRRENKADFQLRRAFGQDCVEVKRSIRLEVAAHNLVLAAQDFTIVDGRVKLWPFSMAIFSKEKEGAWPEINTVRADVAYLSFDRPVNNVLEIGSRRIIGGEISHDPKRNLGNEAGTGGVTLINNRGTPERNDDVSIFTPGPIHYLEKDNRSWTDNVVLLTDLQSRPKPTTITGVGMDVFLQTEKNAAAAKPQAAAKPRVAGVTGLEKIVLRSEVNMHLWIDPRSGFLGGGAAKTKPAQKPEATKEPTAEERVQLVITAPGPFTYDHRSNLATFASTARPAPHGNNVVVHRIHEAEGKQEQVICEHLELQFQRKAAKELPSRDGAKPAVTKRPEPQGELEIQTARATVKPGGHVTIISETENLHATGGELLYDAQARLTTLKGPDMVAVKDGNKIHARELRLKMDERTIQEVIAPGPGRIELLNRDKGERHLHARWQDELTAGREGEVDVLLLTGQAGFEDQQHGQKIQADRIKVWLAPGDARTSKPASKAAAEATASQEPPRRRPQRLEARGHVTATAPDMRVRDTELLVVRFVDAPPPHGPPAPTAPGPIVSGAVVAGPAKPQAASKPKNPLDVSAQMMEAYVLRAESKSELEKLICRGAVRVRQEPDPPDGKEVDMRGDTLELTRHPEGNVLVVIGNTALVKLDQITIIGPMVTIDQKINQANVEGAGAMTMPSETSFEGNKLEKATMLTVHWNKAMYFDGNFAEFDGGIQAEQDNARLACKTMQVYLDRALSFRENTREGPRPKVHKLVCNGNVRVEDKTVENGKLVSQKKLSSKVLGLDNIDGSVDAGGPGVVRIWQLGPPAEAVSGNTAGMPAGSATRPPRAQPQPKAATGEPEPKLTWVSYGGRMWVNNNKKTATFRDEVEVVHMPARDIDAPVNLDALPAGAIHLQCRSLTVLSMRDPSTTTTHQELEAAGFVRVWAQEFWARADLVKYNEKEDKLIFEGVDGNLASLHRQRVAGGPFEEIKGKKITYWRQRNEHKVEGATSIRGSN